MEWQDQYIPPELHLFSLLRTPLPNAYDRAIMHELVPSKAIPRKGTRIMCLCVYVHGVPKQPLLADGRRALIVSCRIQLVSFARKNGFSLYLLHIRMIGLFLRHPQLDYRSPRISNFPIHLSMDILKWLLSDNGFVRSYGVRHPNLRGCFQWTPSMCTTWLNVLTSKPPRATMHDSLPFVISIVGFDNIRFKICSHKQEREIRIF